MIIVDILRRNVWDQWKTLQNCRNCLLNNQEKKFLSKGNLGIKKKFQSDLSRMQISFEVILHYKFILWMIRKRWIFSDKLSMILGFSTLHFSRLNYPVLSMLHENIYYKGYWYGNNISIAIFLWFYVWFGVTFFSVPHKNQRVSIIKTLASKAVEKK